MKKLTLFFCFLFIFSTQIINAQTPRLWGMTISVGIPGDSGMIFQADGNGVAIDSLYSFKLATGVPSYWSPAGLTYAPNGKLYGTTYNGGAFGKNSVNDLYDGYGVIFSFDPTTNTYTDVHDFDSISGSNPVGNLVAATNGLLYGMTEYGGAVYSINDTIIVQDEGVIFSFDPITNAYTDVYSFDLDTTVNNTWVEFGGLMQANNGLLYGLTGGGEIFSFDPNANVFTYLYSPNAVTIQYNQNPPAINLTQANDGDLYGIGYWYGMEPFVFRFDLNVDTVAPLYFFNFNNTDPSFGNLILGKDGKLYGTSIWGGDTSGGNTYGNGFIYSFDPSDSIFTEYNLNSIYSAPYGTLLQAGDGKLYGVCSDTVSNSGNIFSFNISDSSIEDVHDFSLNEMSTIGDLVELDLPYDVWSGDANNDLVVNNYDLLPIGLYYGDTGIARSTVTNIWAAQACTDWDSLQANGMNRKFVDCNGDGTINADDTMAVSLNYGLTHNYNSPKGSSSRSVGTVSLSIVPDSASYHAGSQVHAEVLLGSSGNPAANIYGLAYNIGFSTSIMQPSTLSFTYDNSFIGTKNTNALVLTHLNNDIETAVVGTDHTNKNGDGKIGDLYFTLAANAPTTQLVLSISSYQAVDASGNPITLSPMSDTLSINGTTGINQLTVDNGQLTVYPNPSNGLFTIISSKKIGEIKVTNVLGQLIYESQPKQTQFTFELNDAGIYFVTVISDSETTTKKVVVSR